MSGILPFYTFFARNFENVTVSKIIAVFPDFDTSDASGTNYSIG